MKKILILSLALFLCIMPLMGVVANEYTPGDDLFETVFEGYVLDKDTQEPIDEAYVYAFDENYIEYRRWITDESGYYYLEFSRGGTYSIYAEHPDYIQDSTTESMERNEKKNIDFNLEKKVFDTRIFGSVTDYLTGEPISDAIVYLGEVTIEENGYSTYFSEYFITDEDGTYFFEVYEGNYSIAAEKEGYEDVWSSDPFFVRSGDEYQHDIRMKEWNQGVYGIVTDENGDPMSGLVVTVESDYYRGRNVTDDEGYYEIDIPYTGEYTLKAHEDGYLPYVESIRVNYNQMTEHNIEMVESQLPSPVLKIIYIILSLIAGL